MLRRLALVALVTLVAAGCVSVADAQVNLGDPIDKGFSIGSNPDPAGIWSDGTTVWVADYHHDKLFAYDLNGNRISGKDFNLNTDAGNNYPTGIWSDGNTMWVANLDQSRTNNKIFTYHMNGTYDGTNQFNLTGASDAYPADIWSDGTTMYVVNVSPVSVVAYKMSDKSRDSGQSFNLASGNSFPSGIWSDRTTIWVADDSGSAYGDRVFAYKMSDKSRDTTKEFNFANVGNVQPGGIWAIGANLYVVGLNAHYVYTYLLYPPPPAPAPAPTPRVFVIPPDTTPPTVKSVERTGNATTTNHTLIWDVRFSESVVVRSADIHTNHTSIVNATIPDLGTVYDAILMDMPGTVTGGSVSVDLEHFITGGLLIELVAPDCTKFTIHNQTTTFPYKLRQPYDLGDLSGIGAAGQWELHVSDHAKYWNGTLNGWTLELDSRGAVQGGGRDYTITQYVAGPGEYALSLDGYNIRDWAGNRLKDAEPAVNEPYQVVGAAVRTCQAE